MWYNLAKILTLFHQIVPQSLYWEPLLCEVSSRAGHRTTQRHGKKNLEKMIFLNKKKVAARHSALANAELPPSRPPTSVARPTTAGDCQNVDHHADHVDHHQSLQDLGLDQLSCPLMEWSTERRLSALKLSKAIPTGKCGLVLKLNSLFFTVASLS